MNFNIKPQYFAKLVIIISVFLLLSLFFIVKIVIDPYKEFGLFKLDINKQQFFSSKMSPYVLSEKLINNKFTLVFGTSRSALIDKNMLNEDVINFSSLYGSPIDIYHFLINLNKNKINNIKSIYYLIDAHTFGNKNSYYANKVYSNGMINKIYYSIKTFDLNSLKHAYQSVMLNLKKEKKYLIKNNGTIEHPNKNAHSFKNIEYPEPIKFSKNAFDSLSKINSFANKNNITIIYFNVPLYNNFIKKMNMDSVIKHSKKIIERIDYFYDFRCFPSISKIANNFSTPNHPKYEPIKFALNSFTEYFKVDKYNIESFYKNKWRMCISN